MYLDTAILVKLLVPEPDSEHYVALVDRQIVCSSEIILTECYSALLRKEREGAVAAVQRQRAWRQVEKDVSARRLSLLPVSREVLSSANTILEACDPKIALHSLDAIHLATARGSGSWPLCSNDDRIRRAAERLAIPLCPLPTR